MSNVLDEELQRSDFWRAAREPFEDVDAAPPFSILHSTLPGSRVAVGVRCRWF